jgi:hypothetical protein
LGLSSVCIDVETSEGGFEQVLARRLRDELDALHVEAREARPRPVRGMRLAFGSAAAIAVGAALLLGTVAVFASGSPDPRVWLRQAQHSLGVPMVGEHSPMTVQSSPETSPEPSDSHSVSGGEHESPTPAGTEHESPEPSRPEASQSPDFGAGSRASPGDG